MNHDYEYVAKTYNIKLFGDSHTATEPTSKQSDDFAEQYDAVKDDAKGVVKVYQTFLVTLGLPKDKVEQLPFRAVLDIFSLVTGSKKN